MKRQRLASQGSLSRLFQQAADAWRRQDYQETIDLLERAGRLDPANPAILLDLGRAYGLRYDYAAADRCLEKAVRLAARKSQVLVEAGRRCQEFGLASEFRRKSLPTWTVDGHRAVRHL